MPDVEANRRQWDEDYAWPLLGDEWSAPWGNADAEWSSNANDGRSLAVVDDATVDLAFSFDSLVHVEADVGAAYVSELARVLTPDRIAFIHHSNLAPCRPVDRPWARGAPRSRARTAAGQPRIRLLARRDDERESARRGPRPGGPRLHRTGARRLVGRTAARLHLDTHSSRVEMGARERGRSQSTFHERGGIERASRPRPLELQPTATDSSTVRHLGPLTHIVSASIGPWGISVVGSWPRRKRR